METITVLLVGKNEALLYGLETFLETKNDLQVFSEDRESNNKKVIQKIHAHPPHVLILDFDFWGMRSFSLVDQVKNNCPEVKIIIYSRSSYLFSEELLHFPGISAFISKNASLEEIYSTIKMVFKNFTLFNYNQKAILSAQEQKVLEYVVMGFSNKEIADAIHTSVRTVSYYETCIYNKLNVGNKVKAAVKGILMGYVKEEVIDGTIRN